MQSLRNESRPFVLIVEDNQADIFLIQEALQTCGMELDYAVAMDGDEAIRFLSDEARPCPELVILDINIPRRLGTEVLTWMRQNERCRESLVLAVTTSDSPKDRLKMQELGSDGYFRKPSDLDEFLKLGGIVRELLERQ